MKDESLIDITGRNRKSLIGQYKKNSEYKTLRAFLFPISLVVLVLYPAFFGKPTANFVFFILFTPLAIELFINFIFINRKLDLIIRIMESDSN